jgi:hypothetical protein
MIAHINWHAKQALHRGLARGILAAPPVRPTADRIVIFSMVGTKALYPYLVAAKSLFRQLGRGRIALLDDGTLTADDRRILAAHLGDPEIRTIAEAPRVAVPEGGCWERLVTLLELARDDYVIQLDSDTVTLGSVPEVTEAAARNLPFTMAGESEAEERGFLTLPRFLQAYYPNGGPAPDAQVHVQQAIEANWHLMPGAADLSYVRGCAGFAGFPKGSPGAEAAAEFSAKAEAIVGKEKWASWGSEQVASNFLIANMAGARLLPADRYVNYWNAPPGDAAFLHFIGTYRFHGFEYFRATRAAIAALREPERRRAA